MTDLIYIDLKINPNVNAITLVTASSVVRNELATQLLPYQGVTAHTVFHRIIQ